MQWVRLAVAGVLLPVFPASLIFNALVNWTPTWWGRAAAVVVLPQAGVALVGSALGTRLPLVHSRGWIALIIFSSVLYAFRSISVRDVSIWARLMATSGLSLVWILDVPRRGGHSMAVAALAWSVPAALLLIFAGLLSKRTGGAYLGLQGGLATVAPRMSGVLTLSALALVATPIFPSFFALLQVFDLLALYWLWPLLVVLLVWGWSVGSFLQQLLFGAYRGEGIHDLGTVGASSGAVVLCVLVISAVIWSGVWTGI